MNDLKILLVEDDEQTSVLIKKILVKKFKYIDVAFDGEEALLKYKEFLPNIILTDINMPKMSGLEFIKEVRKIDSDVRIIMLTAFNEQQNLSDAVKLGLDDFLLKPVNIIKLKNALDTACMNYQNDYIFLCDEYYWNITEEALFDKKQEQVILTKNEKNFLSLLCENRNMYFSKYDISEHLYDSSDKLNNVRTLISRLKSKTSTNLIETVFDEGYKIKLR